MLSGLKVAFLGLGAMGLPMALNLQRKGFLVTGWNRTPGKGAVLVEAGGRMAETAVAAVSGTDFVITMLADPAAVTETATGPDGFLKACHPGVAWVDASTVGPTAARQLAEVARVAGVDFVDAPVLGSVQPATEGTLPFVVGGTPAAVDKVRPLLDAMGSIVAHMGLAGQGAAAKIVANMITGVLVATLGEALALAEKLGLDRVQVAEMLKEGPVGSRIVRAKAPAMLAENFTPAFQLKWMEKDIGLALAEALLMGAPMSSAAGALAEYAGARANGMGDMDFAAVGGFIRRIAKGPKNE